MISFHENILRVSRGLSSDRVLCLLEVVITVLFGENFLMLLIDNVDELESNSGNMHTLYIFDAHWHLSAHSSVSGEV